jgi:serine/threonine protein kinase
VRGIIPLGMYVCPECGSSSAGPGLCAGDGVALEDGSRDDLLGRTVGSYRIARRIGAGGMGEVYRGVQPHIGSRVAIKVLSHECAKSAALVERFFAEARAVNLIRHENIVNVVDLSSLPDGRPYIVMEHLEGAPLSAILRRFGPMPLGTLARLVGDLLDALDAAHSKGVVHRDLKPDNVFVSQSGRAKVLDFGIAKLRPDLASSSDATRTGSLLGTPHYMSPEQALGSTVDPRSDLYSTGVILYECATGKRPFDAPTLFELLRQHIERLPDPPRSLRPDMPPVYEGVLLRALEKDPSRRFQSAREFAGALAQAASGAPPEAWIPISGNTAAPPSGFVASGTPVASGPFVGHAGTPSVPMASSALEPARSAPGSTAAPATAPSPGAPPPMSSSAHSAAAPGTGTGLSNTLASGNAKKHGLFALATCGVLAIAGVGAMLGLGVIGFAVTDHESDGSEADPRKPRHERGWGEYDAQRFDVIGFLPRAETLAKKFYRDAVFVRLDARGVTAQGLFDVTQRSASATYQFRSPKRSQPPASHPGNTLFKSNCVVHVTVDKDGITSRVPESSSCDVPLLAKPRCSPAQVWAKAAERGAQTNRLATLSFRPDERDHGLWFLHIQGGFSDYVPDSC